MDWSADDGKALYAILFEEASDAILIYNEHDEILDVNKQACRLYGYSREEFLGMGLQDLQAPDRGIETGNTIQEEIARYGTGPFETVDITKQGVRINIEVSNTPMTVGEQRIVFSITRDITERKRRELATEEASALQRAIVESPENINIWAIDLEFRYIFFNNAHREGMRVVWGVDIAVGDSLLDQLSDEEYRLQTAEEYRGIFAGRQHRSVDKLEKVGGGHRYYENFATPMKNSIGEVIGAVVYATDVTERMALEEDLKRTVALLESIMNSPPDILILSVDREYRYTFFNNAHKRGMLDVWGTVPELGRNIFEFVPDEEYRREVKQYYDGALAGEMWTRQSSFTDVNGKVRYFDNFSAPVKNNRGEIVGITVFITEITDRIRDEKRLQESLHEKEILLREVHHRVKNNLQIVSSLLNMQIARETDGTVTEQLIESQNRIVTMALIHEHLYESENLARINIDSYIRELAEVMLRTYSAQRMTLRMEYDLEPQSLDIETSIPLGLIFNELITNSIKYAFPEGREGRIRVTFKTEGTGQERTGLLETADDGVGCDTSQLEPGASGGLGLQIVDALTKQLQGTYTVLNSGGLISRIRFPLRGRGNG